MNRYPDDDDISRLLADCAERGIPSTVDIRSVVRRRLAERERSRGYPRAQRTFTWLARAAAIIAICAFLSGEGAAVAAAASPKVCGSTPEVCTRLEQLAKSAAAYWSLLLAMSPSHASQVTAGNGIGMRADQRTITVVATASFAVVTPGYIPDSLTQREYAYVPPQQSGSVPTKSAIGSEGIAASARALEATKQLRGDQGGGVWLRFASPTGNRFLEVLEQPLRPGQSLPPGEPVNVSGSQAVIQTRDDQTIVALIRSNVAITVRTNLGRSEALRVAQSLH